MPPSPQARTVALPQRWPLIVQPGNRDATQRFDAKLINGYAEKDRTTGEYQVYRRLGLSAPKYQLSGAGRGMFQWIGDASVTYGPVTPPSIPPFNCNIIAGYNPIGVYTGYISGSIGSIDNANIGAGISVVSVYDDATVGAVLGVTGFSSDPGSTYIVSVTANGVTLNAPSAVYSYNAGTAFWQWNVPVMYFGFVIGLPYPVTINFANSGPQTLIYTAAPILVMIAGMTVSILTQGASPVLSTLGSIPSGGICRFCQINAAIPLLLFGDGVTGTYYTDGSTITRITDPNFPTSTVPGLAILDGTIYVMTPQGQIFGSANLDDPSTWSATNVAVAGVEGDLGVYLARQLTYIIAFKQWTIQVFFDNANPSGSPLSPVYGAVINYGCLSAQTVQDLMGALYFVCNSKLGTPQVGVVDNLAFKVVSSPAVDRLLESATINTPFYSFPLHKGGHRFYVLSRLDTGVTMVYDLDQELWYFWQASSGACWPIVAQAYDLYGNTLLQDQATGAVYGTDIAAVYPNDNGIGFPMDIYTPNFDGGTMRSKQLSMMLFNADQVSGSALQVRYSDNDYQSWSDPQTVDLGLERPQLPDQGSFYKRAYWIRHNVSTACRIRSVDLQMDLGVS